jgi:SAM-dependent methyltransferase
MPTHDLVRSYYGQELTSSADLKTSACCDADAVPDELKPLLARLHPSVTERYYGCGLVAPPLLEGCTVLDLGCGAGRDVYLLAQLVGPHGRVIGVDMTPEQLAVARGAQAFQASQMGYDNVRFLEGSIEELDALGLPAGSVDVVVSNCVLNLSTDKGAVLRGVKQLLKPGGEFYFSDVYSDRRLSEEARHHPVLYGECLGGALYWNDFLSLARASGFPDPRLVSDRQLQITDPTLLLLVDGASFFSATYRLFHLDGLEEACEDYGHTVIYQGTIPGQPDGFALDDHHLFPVGARVSVCRNTARMISETRLADHFECLGEGGQHRGLFAGCGQALPFASAQGSSAQGSSAQGSSAQGSNAQGSSARACC